MNSGMISMRYARALLDFSTTKGVEDEMFTQMRSLSVQFSVQREFRMAMDNPVLGVEDKLSLILTAVGKSTSEFSHFVQFVLHQKRENHLYTIALVYVDLYRESKKINVGKLVTAVPPSDDVIEKMKDLLRTKCYGTLEFDSEIDASIEGGFVLYVDTYRLDASVSTQIRKIRQQLIERNRKVV